MTWSQECRSGSPAKYEARNAHWVEGVAEWREWYLRRIGSKDVVKAEDGLGAM